MLPGQILSSPALPAAFLAPRNFIRSAGDGALAPAALGGAGFRDTSQGLASQAWVGSYDGTNCVLTPQTGAPITVAITAVAWFDFCFDQSMNPIIAYADVFGLSHFRWFDSTINNFTVTDLPFGTDPWPYCALDDSRPAEASSSDVIVTYTRAGGLYFLAQRDRFGVEYSLGAVPPPKVLTQAGISIGNRFQFQFNALLPDQFAITGKFVPAGVFSAVLLTNVGNIKPKIYAPKEDVTVRTHK